MLFKRWMVWVLACMIGSLLSPVLGGIGFSQSGVSVPGQATSPGLFRVPFDRFGRQAPPYLNSSESDVVTLSSGLLGGLVDPIPNLEAGFIYTFGHSFRSYRGTLDYVLPISTGPLSAIFGEAHGELQDFWKRRSADTILVPGYRFTTSQGGSGSRLDLSLGGGYRRVFSGTTLVGANAFYDTSRIFGRWYTSGGAGLEFASLIGQAAAFDISFNYYGNIWRGATWLNPSTLGGGGYDFEFGYSQPVFNDLFDVRLKAKGYHFPAGVPIRGWRVGAELNSRDAMVSLRYACGSDRTRGLHHTVSGFFTVGLELERLLSGNNPFVMPEPIARNPRNVVRWLSQPVRREWHRPASTLARSAASTPAGSTSVSCDDLTRVIPGPHTMALDWTTFTCPNCPVIDFFLYVPHWCLDPTRSVRVSFDFEFEFGAGPGTVTLAYIRVHVQDASGGADVQGLCFLMGNSGTGGAWLVPVQAEFTTPEVNPERFSSEVVDMSGWIVAPIFPTALHLTNIEITFNN